MNCSVNEGSIYNAIPYVNPGEFNGVLFVDQSYSEGDNCWGVRYFEGKSKVISFVKVGTAPLQEIAITQIELRPAPTMTFLNPRPAPGSSDYPWRYDGDAFSHKIKLPLPLTYAELKEGSQIVVSGVTETLDVIQGTVEGNLLLFRAGGLLIGHVTKYEGTSDLVNIVIREDFTGEILAVNFDKAYKNLPVADSVKHDSDGIVSYLEGQNTIAKCVLNDIAIWDYTPFIPSNGLLGNLVFHSLYIENYGNVIESYYWTNGRYLYIIRLDESYAMQAINLDSTVSPLDFPII